MTAASLTPSRAAAPLTPAEIASRKRAGWLWPMAIVGLILMNATIVTVTVVLAVGDPSAAVEPDYYAKALAFEDTIKQRETNARMGWTAEPSLSVSADGRSAQLVVTLADRDHRPIPGASVTIVAFPNIRSSERQGLKGVETQPGQYSAPIHVTRAGYWRVRIIATVGFETFTRESDLLLPAVVQ